MLGTIANTFAIVIATSIGVVLHRGIGQKYRESMFTALGLVSIVIGFNATLTHLPKSNHPLMFILAMCIGGALGTYWDVDGAFQRLLDRRRTEKDSESSRIAEGFSTAVLLYCIGPLSMLGPVMSALKGDNTFLYTNATLDFVSAMIFGSTYGYIMLLTAPILFLWQGMFYVIALMSSTAVSHSLMNELLIVGGMLIVASGLNLLKIKNCKVLNFLPALLIPIFWFLLEGLWGMVST